MAASRSSLSVLVVSHPLYHPGPHWYWMYCGSPASLENGLVLVGRHPSALLSGVSENRQLGRVVRLGQRVGVTLGSLGGLQDRARVRSAGVVDHLFQVTVPGVVHGRGNSLILCTGSSVVATAVVFGLQTNKRGADRSMDMACGTSSSQYVRDSPVGNPWRDSLFSAEGYWDVFDGEGRSGSRRPPRRLRLVSTSLATTSVSGSLGRRRAAASYLATSSTSASLTREVRGLALRDLREWRDRGSSPPRGMCKS